VIQTKVALAGGISEYMPVGEGLKSIRTN